MVYKYRSESSYHQAWNGHRIEIQVRSALQHAWATTVETVDTFTGQALKFTGVGKEGWDRFFALMWSVLAIQEHRPVVPGTTENRRDLQEELEYWVDDLDVFNTLGGLGVVVEQGEVGTNDAYFLVFLNPDEQRVFITSYSTDELRRAQRDYLDTEGEIEGKAGFQACLVSTDSVKAIRHAYPNYYLDTSAFVKALSRVLNR